MATTFELYSFKLLMLKLKSYGINGILYPY